MSKGSILIYTSAAGQAAPLPGVTLTVTDAAAASAPGSSPMRTLAEPPTCPPPIRLQSGLPPTRQCSPTQSTALKLHWTAGSPLC